MKFDGVTKESQGRRANEHGKRLRRAVAGIILSHGFDNIGPVQGDPRRSDPVRAFDAAVRSYLSPPARAFARDVKVCYHFYDSPLKANFLLHARGWPHPLALMTRGQNNTGSARDKLEWLFANIHERFPERLRALVLLDGAEFTPPVLARARQWVERSGGRVARVFHGLSELRVWFTDGCAFPDVPAPCLLS
jgi:hypothetical protein